MAEVVLADAEDAGLASMLAGLLCAAVEHPAKAAILDAMSGTVNIVVPDAEVEVGLRFGQGVCRVHAGPIPGAKVRIQMPSETLLGMSTVPLLFGLPSVLTPAGRRITRQILTGEVKIRGMHHVGLVTQLNRLLSLV